MALGSPRSQHVALGSSMPGASSCSPQGALLVPGTVASPAQARAHQGRKNPVRRHLCPISAVQKGRLRPWDRQVCQGTQLEGIALKEPLPPPPCSTLSNLCTKLPLLPGQPPRLLCHQPEGVMCCEPCPLLWALRNEELRQGSPRE